MYDLGEKATWWQIILASLLFCSCTARSSIPEVTYMSFAENGGMVELTLVLDIRQSATKENQLAGCVPLSAILAAYPNGFYVPRDDVLKRVLEIRDSRGDRTNRVEGINRD